MRHLGRLFLCLFVAWFFIGTDSVLRAQKAPLSRPNIVFILADDLGWADVQFHGGRVPTPNLNQLAQTGLELTRHYVAPVCSPTRTGLLTGRYWSRFDVTTPQNQRALPWETVTLARALGAAGYDTALVGKWHLGSLPEWNPRHFGFEHAYGSLAGGVTPWSHRYKKGPYSHTWHRNGNLIQEEGHVTDLLTAEAVAWLKQRGSRPFFLYLPFTAVHLPIREPDEWLAKVPASIEGEVPRQYAACILHLDAAVGTIVRTLRETGHLENTLIVFTSDNGGSTTENNDTKYPNLGDDCPSGRLPGDNRPWRGKKGSLYEGGTRVPTIVHWPGRIAGARRDDTPVYIVDWMPTFCALAGSPFQADALKWDGRDLQPVLFGTGTLPDRALYSAGPHYRTRALWHGPWKLLVRYDGSGKEQRCELYHLGEDPGEQHDLAQKKPSRVETLRAMLRDQMARDGDATVARQ